jgi:hypothetical protein
MCSAGGLCHKLLWCKFGSEISRTAQTCLIDSEAASLHKWCTTCHDLMVFTNSLSSHSCTLQYQYK